MKYPIVLSIAGSDSCGGAGIQADIKTCSALGVYAATAITAVTVQNTQGVSLCHGIPPEVVAAQIRTVFDDIAPDAVKAGMLYSREVIKAVADALIAVKARNVVVDPVMISTSGHPLISRDAIRLLKDKIIPLADILTPNRNETAELVGFEMVTAGDEDRAAMTILRMGCKSVLIKGGHFDGDLMIDRLYLKDGRTYEFSGPRVDTKNTHGTGCTLSSAIASQLALGHPIESAVDNARRYLQGALEAGAAVAIGHGNGPVNHLYNPQKLIAI